MADTPTIVMGALNIAADPHPKGVYRTLFEAAADKPIRLWGSDWAKITAPIDRESTQPSFYGRILVWTEIDRDGRWLNQAEDREATPTEKRAIQIPEILDPNFRSFNFVFIEDRHLLILEYQNELGEHFGPQRAEKLFRRLFVKDEPDEGEPVVEVTVVPSTEALDKIFAIPQLRKLEINVVRPNPDSLDEQEERILQKLLDQGAKEQTLILKKRAGVKKLEPDDKPRVNLVYQPYAREGADGQAVVCPLLRGSSATRGVAPKQHRGPRVNLVYQPYAREGADGHARALMARPWSARCYGVARPREGSRQNSVGGGTDTGPDHPVGIMGIAEIDLTWVRRCRVRAMQPARLYEPTMRPRARKADK